MLSARTCIELAYVIEGFIQAEVDRIFYVFDMKYLIIPPDPSLSRAKKVNFILGKLQVPSLPGPFGHGFQMDLLQYVVDKFYREKNNAFSGRAFDSQASENLFSDACPALSHSLKRDGYVVQGQVIRKLLPAEIEEAKTESALEQLLTQFGFDRSKGHLEQGKSNHSQGNWAGANGQFRTFVESLLIEITQLLLPGNACNSAAAAIQLLSLTASPPFFETALNEVEHSNCRVPFVEGLWKRLHPQGNHPGLSSEEDCTFRYHLVVVFAHYLLKRLDKRLTTTH